MPSKDVIVACRQQTALDLEIFVDGQGPPVLLGVQDLPVKGLHDQFAQLGQGLRPSVVDLHELFHRQFFAVHHFPKLSQFLLLFKEQSVFATTIVRMQCKAHLADEVLSRFEHAFFIAVQEVRLIEVFKGNTIMAPGDPTDDLNIPQTTGSVFDMGFQVVFCIAEMIVSGLCLLQFGAVKLFAVPHLVIGNDPSELIKQGRTAGDAAGFQQ